MCEKMMDNEISQFIVWKKGIINVILMKNEKKIKYDILLKKA